MGSYRCAGGAGMYGIIEVSDTMATLGIRPAGV